MDQVTPQSPLSGGPFTVVGPPAVDQSVRVTTFLAGVYAWMCGGLAITAATAWYVAGSPSVLAAIAGNRAVLWVLIIAQFGIVLTLSARVQQMASSTASLLFACYSALTGVTLSFVLMAYTGESVAQTFLITSGSFGGLAAFDTLTRRNLSGFGQFLFMGLIGVVLASVVGMFWHSDGLQFILSVIGVIVFAGLTAYDAQRLKAMALVAPEGQTSTLTVVGALTLYLDFINLFLFLLRFTGDRRR